MSELKMELVAKSSIQVNGQVWIGDPCYVPVLHNVWDDFLDVYWENDDCPTAVISINGIEMIVGNTEHGDGTYEVSNGGECGVDAGLLCVIPSELFSFLGLDKIDNNDHGGVFTEASGCAHIDEKHTVHAGLVTVITGDRCEGCGGLEGECDCEECTGCGEWDYCTCDDDHDEDEQDEFDEDDFEVEDD